MATITLTIELTDTEQAILNNDMLSINNWLQGAKAGVINHAWKTMRKEWIDRLTALLIASRLIRPHL